MEIKHDHIFPILSKCPNARFIYRHDLWNWKKSVPLQLQLRNIFLEHLFLFIQMVTLDLKAVFQLSLFFKLALRGTVSHMTSLILKTYFTETSKGCVPSKRQIIIPLPEPPLRKNTVNRILDMGEPNFEFWLSHQLTSYLAKG